MRGRNTNWKMLKKVLAVPLLVLVGILAACSQAVPAVTPVSSGTAYAHPELLVETDWLSQHLNDANLRVVDVRKAADYEAGHIKNSVNLNAMDPKGPLYDQDNPVTWIVLPKDKIESLLGNLGISNDTTVVAVDDARGLWASRLFWTLEYYGHGNGKARVLNGGLKKWQAEKHELTTEPPNVKKATFVAKPDPSKLVTKEQVLASLGKSETVILATIPEAEFRGGNEKGHVQGGHIPGAVRLDWTENLAEGDVLKPTAELAPLYEDIGVTRDKNVVVY